MQIIIWEYYYLYILLLYNILIIWEIEELKKLENYLYIYNFKEIYFLF